MSRRLFLIRVFAVNFFLLLVGQLFRLQVVEGPRYAGQAEQNRIRRVFTRTLRGVIYDRTGKLLVRNLPSFNVSILPADLPPAGVALEPHTAAQLTSKRGSAQSVAPQATTPTEATVFLRLSRLLQIDKADIVKQVDSGRANPFAPVLLKSNVDRDVALMIEESRREMPGVVIDLLPIREYLEGALLSGIVGYTGRISDDEYQQRKVTDRSANMNDTVGRMGIETVFDEELSGHKGEKVVEVDAAGREARPLAQVTVERPGRSLILTIDLELQRQATKALQQGMVRAGASSGSVVALNPNSGEVLALVSLPSYDNNKFAPAISDADWQQLLNDPNRPLFNRAIGGAYPPGSIFKIITGTGGLQDGIMTLDTRIRCDGKISVQDQYNPNVKYNFPCWQLGGHGWQTVIDALANSCDVFFYHIGGGYEDFQGLGIDRLNKYMRDFGLGAATGIDLPGEAAGTVPNNQWKIKQTWNTRGEPWLTGDTYNLAIGQGYLLATPLQMANVVSVIANGGTIYRPQLVFQVVDADGKLVRAYNKEVLGRVSISAKNLEIMREGMRSAVTRGTAIATDFASVGGDLAVVGKTGTAEFGQANEKGVHPAHAWFLSYAPENNPTVALAVFIEGGKNGAEYAVPVAAQIYQYMFHQPDVPLPLVPTD
jgi:penicillin-binding protein 2